MEFEATPLDWGILLRGGWAWKVFAHGEIDAAAGERFQGFLVQNSIPYGSELYLHSAGGNLLGGMELGRVIRDHGFVAHIGRKGNFDGKFQRSEPGICMSACALAFLGGEYRYACSQSQYGIHRFSLSGNVSANVDSAQQLSASVVSYLGSMEIDIELFAIASEVASDDILILPKETLERLNVINNGFKKPKWSIESIAGALYLKGERETIYGVQKYLIVFPAEGASYLHIIFDGARDADVFMTMEADRFVVDNDLIPAREYRVSRVNDNGKINATYLLPTEFLERLCRAKVVGMCFQFTEEAPMFVGFDNLPFEEGAVKLPGLMALWDRASR